MHFNVSSATYFNLDQSKVLPSVNVLNKALSYNIQLCLDSARLYFTTLYFVLNQHNDSILSDTKIHLAASISISDDTNDDNNSKDFKCKPGE